MQNYYNFEETMYVLNEQNERLEVHEFLEKFRNLDRKDKFDYLEKIIIINYLTEDDLSKIFSKSISDVVKFYQFFNLKVCANKENCANTEGPVQIRNRSNFNTSGNELASVCKTCLKQISNQRQSHKEFFRNLAERQEWNYFEVYTTFQEQFNKWNYLSEIIKENCYGYIDIAKILDCSLEYSIWLFQVLDIKICSSNECVSPSGKIQTRSNFYSSKDKNDGLDSRCIYCFKEKYKNNIEKEKERSRLYRYNNLEYCRKKDEQRYYNNLEYFHEKGRNYYINNSEYLHKKGKDYYHNNKSYFSERAKKYRKNNFDAISKYTKVYNKSYSRFDTFSNQISYAEEIRRDPNNLELLQIRCTYCNSWFNPTNLEVRNRIRALEGQTSSGTENRFYCSDECKQACPIYDQKKYSKDDPNRNYIATSREVQPELRQLVFERDNWTCQRCNTHKDNLPANISLHCHHIEGIRHEPIESADVDMCMTVCKNCHKKIHQIPGCTYQDMQCKDYFEDSKNAKLLQF